MEVKDQTTGDTVIVLERDWNYCRAMGCQICPCCCLNTLRVRDMTRWDFKTKAISVSPSVLATGTFPQPNIANLANLALQICKSLFLEF